MTQRAYFVRPPDLKCSSENVVYYFTCKTCSKQNTESTEDMPTEIDMPTETFWKEKKWNKS